MTLVLGAAAGSLVSGQFGVNELASAITVGRFVGSIFSRQQDAKIVDMMAELNKLELKELPDWLTTIEFTRRATIYGDRMRRLSAPNVMSDVDIASPEGIATFMALILRFVQTPEDTADSISQLLKGKFGVLTHVTNGSPGNIADTSLPYAVKGNLIKFIKSVWETDKDSDQSGNCLQWLSELTSCVGKSSASNVLTSYSLVEQRRLMQCLLSSKRSIPHRPEIFHTLSIGAAMIAVAARAQGAGLQLVCISQDEKQIPFAEDRNVSLVVKLWLVSPPPAISAQIPGLDSSQRLSKQQEAPSLAVYGGVAEISNHVAQQLRLPIDTNDGRKVGSRLSKLVNKQFGSHSWT